MEPHPKESDKPSVKRRPFYARQPNGNNGVALGDAEEEVAADLAVVVVLEEDGDHRGVVVDLVADRRRRRALDEDHLLRLRTAMVLPVSMDLPGEAPARFPRIGRKDTCK